MKVKDLFVQHYVKSTSNKKKKRKREKGKSELKSPAALERFSNDQDSRIGAS